MQRQVIFILLYFLLGIIFCQWVMPLIDGILNVILTALETVKGKLSVKITDYTIQIQNMSNPDTEIPKNVIGFALPDYEEEEDEEEDENL